MDLTKKCLDTIPDGQEVILIDNSTVAECRNYAAIRSFLIKQYIRPEREPLSYAASLNTGIKASSSAWVILANNDLLFQPSAFERFASLPKEGGPDLFITEVRWSCVMLSRKAYEQVGGFDESFIPCAGEDDDFMVRFCKAGLKWQIVPIGIWHQEGGHHCRIDGGRNIKLFEHKHKMKYGSPEHQEIINSGQWKKSEIWVPSA